MECVEVLRVFRQDSYSFKYERKYFIVNGYDSHRNVDSSANIDIFGLIDTQLRKVK